MSEPLDPDDDDAELELAPIDPDVLASERARHQRKIDDVVSRVDVDELVRETSIDDDLKIDWEGWKSFRFSTIHLLGLTAALAVLLTVLRSPQRGLAFFILIILALAGGWYWVLSKERILANAREARKKELIAKGFGTAFANHEAAKVAAAEFEPARPLRGFRFSFSIAQVLITMTVAAVAMTLLHLVGGQVLSLSLGLLAAAGFLVYMLGFEVAPILVFGWWMLLLLYLIVGVITALASGK